MMRAPRPRVVSVGRRHPGQVSLGDTAEVRLDPGLIAFLENTSNAGGSAAGDCVALGAGFHARYNIPVSMAASAAAAVLTPADRAGTYWSGRDLEVEWLGVSDLGDTVLAQARLEEFSERLSRFSVYGRTLRDRALYRGTLRLIAIRDGCPAGFRSRAEYEAVRARLDRRAVPSGAGRRNDCPVASNRRARLDPSRPVCQHRRGSSQPGNSPRLRGGHRPSTLRRWPEPEFSASCRISSCPPSKAPALRSLSAQTVRTRSIWANLGNWAFRRMAKP